MTDPRTSPRRELERAPGGGTIPADELELERERAAKRKRRPARGRPDDRLRGHDRHTR